MNFISEIERAHQAGRVPAFAYDRVSTTKQEQEGMSLEYQARHSRRYAEENNLEIIQVYSSAESAFKEGRKNFNRMLDDALKYGIKDIIFKNTDRLGRNDVDWPRCKKLSKEKGFRIHLYELGSVFTKQSTAEEELFLDNTAGFAIYWSNKLSKAVLRAYADKTERGIPPAIYPIGYIYDKQKQKHFVDPNKKDMMNFLFNEFDNNNISIETLAERLNNKGYRTKTGKLWLRPYLHALLQNPFYAGKFWRNGELHQGTQEVYFTWDRFLKRQERLGERWQGKKKRNFDFPLANLLISADGFVLTGEQKKEKYNYYSHKHDDGRIYYTEQKIFTWIDKAIEDIQYSKDYAEYLKATFKSVMVEAQDNRESLTRSITKQISDIERKQKKLLELWTEDAIDIEMLKAQSAEYKAQRRALVQQKEQATDIKDDIILEIVEVIDKLRKLPHSFKQSSVEEKSILLRSMVKKVRVHAECVTLEWRKPFSWIIKTVPFKDTVPVLTGTALRAEQNNLRIICADILMRWAA